MTCLLCCLVAQSGAGGKRRAEQMEVRSCALAATVLPSTPLTQQRVHLKLRSLHRCKYFWHHIITIPSYIFKNHQQLGHPAGWLVLTKGW